MWELFFLLKIERFSLPKGRDRKGFAFFTLCVIQGRSMKSQTSCIHTKALFSDALLACEILPMIFHAFKQQPVCFAFSCQISLVK